MDMDMDMDMDMGMGMGMGMDMDMRFNAKVSVYGGALRHRCTSSYCGSGRYLAGAASDDERAERPSRMRLGGQQRQRRQQIDVPGVGIVLEPARETAPLTARCGTAASCGPVERP